MQMRGFSEELLPIPRTHAGGVSSHQVLIRLCDFSPHPKPRISFQSWLGWGHQISPRSWKKGEPNLMAGYLFLPEIDAPHLDPRETQPDLSQGLEGSREQEGDLALTENVIQSEGEEVEASGCQNDFEDEEAMESDPGALDKDFQCPREEDTIKILGGSECKTCRYLLVRQPRSFRRAQVCDREATAEGGLEGGEECGLNLLFPIQLGDCFSKPSVHQNLLEVLLKPRFLV